MIKNILMLLFGFTFVATSFGQFCEQSLLFTWEGDTIGNRAVWKVNDVVNTYSLNNVDVTVSLQDPYSVNTTTSNPSEFADYTKSNAYFGPGSLMLQASSTSSNQPLCLKYSFSKPVIINDFRVFDIDFIARGRAESSFQDSVSFRASMNGRDIPLSLQYLSLFPNYIILGQSARSKYIVNTNGDIQHTDPKGGLRVHSNQNVLNSFTVCYANGPADDGMSNSHAIKIISSDFCIVGLGSIGGQVRSNTNQPLGGSVVQLFDTLGVAVLNEFGLPIVTTTQADGLYYFEDVPLGYYNIIQINDPLGYHSESDNDGGNDNKIRAYIDIVNPISLGNDFIEGFGPLPVSFGRLHLSLTQKNDVQLNWYTFTETNNDFFTIQYSGDGKNYEKVTTVNSKGFSADKTTYEYIHSPDSPQNILYYKLFQTDFDGTEKELATSYIRRNQNNQIIRLYPNPVISSFYIAADKTQTGMPYIISDVSGRVVQEGMVNDNPISVISLAPGAYFIRIHKESDIIMLPFQKM
ncbi:MAG: T9SS type A sorting domain-containing protein [Saprospiraceae bacterium]|nr:T9SS type A sorting domain-containing protein [Saprospiraceae bacterium]